MPGNPLPPNVKALSAYGAWAGPDITQPSNELDVWVCGDDGKVYHWWLKANVWQGPESFG
jgi:hypothetical protein